MQSPCRGCRENLGSIPSRSAFGADTGQTAARVDSFDHIAELAGQRPPPSPLGNGLDKDNIAAGPAVTDEAGANSEAGLFARKSWAK